MGCILAIMSGKGGVGKTTLTASLGGALHRAGKSVLITDADFGMRDLDLVVGKEDEIFFDAVDIWKDNCTSDYAILSLGDGFDFLPATQSRRWEDVGRKGYAKLISRLAEKYDYVIIDSPAGIGRGNEAIFKAAERIILVAEPLWVSMRAVQRVVQMCREIRQFNYTLVLNGVGHSNAEVSVEDALAALQVEQLGTILPYREEIQCWSQEGILHEEVDPFFDGMMDTLVQALINDEYEPEEAILEQWKAAKAQYAPQANTAETEEVLETVKMTETDEAVEPAEAVETAETVATNEIVESAESRKDAETAETVAASAGETAEATETTAKGDSETAEIAASAEGGAEATDAEATDATAAEEQAQTEAVEASDVGDAEKTDAESGEQESSESKAVEETKAQDRVTQDTAVEETKAQESEASEEPVEEPKKKRGGLASLLRRQLASLWSRRSRMR